jgi:hypothetical protein
MPTEKVSLTLEEELVIEARVIAGQRGLSRYVTRALRNQLQQDRIGGFLQTLENEAGPVEQGVMDEVRKAWPAEGATASQRRSA